MCTIIAMLGVRADLPLVVAANRDEAYGRASAPPARAPDPPHAVAGVDLERGGTWMGATPGGLFVGLTNQRSWTGYDPSLRSRGALVGEALRRGDVDGVTAYLRTVDATRYNPFNLMYGDASSLRVAYARADAEAIEVIDLPAGVHVLANDRLGSPHFPKTERAAALCRAAADAPAQALVDTLSAALSDHALPDEAALPDPPPGALVAKPVARQLQALCIHTPFYGTRSSTILAMTPGRVARYLFADGPPCRTPLRDVTRLVNDGGA